MNYVNSAYASQVQFNTSVSPHITGIGNQKISKLGIKGGNSRQAYALPGTSNTNYSDEHQQQLFGFANVRDSQNAHATS